MENKTAVEVMIGGRTYSLTGYEDNTYLQKVAAYINGRDHELMKSAGYAKQKADMQNVLLQLNIADDYFKVREELDDVKRKLNDRDKELYKLKHELVTLRMKYENIDKK